MFQSVDVFLNLLPFGDRLPPKLILELPDFRNKVQLFSDKTDGVIVINLLA